MRASNVSPSAYILLNIAHIEITAVHTYWDTIVRFSHRVQRPRPFIDDFLGVVADECRHFQMCQERLGQLGHRYGDVAAHSALWDHVAATSGDVLARLAVVPMAQEARGRAGSGPSRAAAFLTRRCVCEGLDAGPRFVRTLEQERDAISADAVRRIVLDEVGPGRSLPL